VITEIFSEIAHEISSEPMRFLAEILQFGILVLIVWFIAVGFGAKRGFVRNMLAERRQRTYDHIEESLRSSGTLEEARQVSTSRVRAARAEARRIVGAAKREAAKLETASKEEADSEAERIHARVEETLATELDEMHAELREELVELVAQATRRMLNERMTVAEQRRLIEEHVMASVAEPGAYEALEEASRA